MQDTWNDLQLFVLLNILLLGLGAAMRNYVTAVFDHGVADYGANNVWQNVYEVTACSPLKLLSLSLQ